MSVPEPIGTWVGRTPSPKDSFSCSTTVSKSMWAASSLVSAITRGRLAAEHSSHRAWAMPSTPSAATTKMAASAARMPARSSPTKSG